MKIENVKIINPNETIENARITIDGEKITSIEPMKGKATKVVVPGFIDTHMHGFVGYDFMDGRDETKKILEAVAKHGTTTVFATAMTGDWNRILEVLEILSSTIADGAKICGIHLEGPFISEEKKGAHDAKYLVVPTAKNVKEVIKASHGMLKKVTIAPELVTKDVAKLFNNSEVTMTLGHGSANAEVTRKAIELGATSATHLWNAMSGVANRNPGMVEVFLQEDKVYTELITDLIHVDKEAIALTFKNKTADKIVIISDAIRPAGLDNGEFKSGGLDIVKNGELITLKGTNTIAGSASTMHSNFKKMIELGYNENDVVKMTSFNAAKSLKLPNTGEIKKGNLADLVIMNKKWDIKTVYINGEEIKG